MKAVKSKFERGFTLIELLVVIAIIGLLSTLAIVALGTARLKSRDARRLSDLKQIQTALELYASDNSGTYPSTTSIQLGDTAHSCLNNLGFQPANCTGTVYLATIPKDPNNGYYSYSGGGNNYIVAASLEKAVGNLSGRIGVTPSSGIISLNLVTNGAGLMNSNYNFSSFVFDSSDMYSGNGSFKNAVFTSGPTSDEFMPVDGNNSYVLSLWAKSTTHAVGSHAYLGLAPYDADHLLITPPNYIRVAGTDTTLASALHTGDTVVHLTTAANWNVSNPNAYARQIQVFNYSNSLGYSYPPYSYTRNDTFDNGYSAVGAWAVGGISGNDITLTAPWPASLGTIPAGTPVSNGTATGWFLYIAASNVDIPVNWTKYSGSIGGWDIAGVDSGGTLFPMGTVAVKVQFLLNRDVAGNVTNVSDVQFYQQ